MKKEKNKIKTISLGFKPPVLARTSRFGGAAKTERVKPNLPVGAFDPSRFKTQHKG